MIKVGDVYELHISFGTDYVTEKTVTYPGTVVYVHPRRRFFTARFDFGRGQSFCQSYYIRPTNLASEASETEIYGKATGIYFEDLIRVRQESKKRKGRKP